MFYRQHQAGSYSGFFAFRQGQPESGTDCTAILQPRHIFCYRCRFFVQQTALASRLPEGRDD